MEVEFARPCEIFLTPYDPRKLLSPFGAVEPTKHFLYGENVDKGLVARSSYKIARYEL